MSIEIRLPNITGLTEREQLSQIKSYLMQLAQQLQWALDTVSSSSGQNTAVQQVSSRVDASALPSGVAAQTTFNALKPLIIKSADIVNAYYEEINRRLDGEYVAQSDFGTYKESTSQQINETSTEVERLFTNVQQIITDIETLEYNLIETQAHIRSGLLYYDSLGVPIYGLEIGQKKVIDGVEVFNKYARFTSDRLSFYDQNDSEVAYISDYKLYITHVEITGTAKLGAFLIDTTSGLKIKYVGRG